MPEQVPRLRPTLRVLRFASAAAILGLLALSTWPSHAAPAKKKKKNEAEAEATLAEAPPESPPVETPPVEGDPTVTDPTLGEGPPEAPSEASQTAPPTLDTEKLASLRDEAGVLRDELFKARARVSTLTSKLYASALAMELKSNIERFYAVENFTITLDGAPVYFTPTGLGPSTGTLFDMFAAPGSHEVGISAKLTARRDQTFRVELDQTFTLVVPADARLETKLRLHEGGNMFGSFPKRNRGAYIVLVTLEAKTKKNKTKKSAPKTTTKAKASMGGAPGAPGGGAK